MFKITRSYKRNKKKKKKKKKKKITSFKNESCKQHRFNDCKIN